MEFISDVEIVEILKGIQGENDHDDDLYRKAVDDTIMEYQSSLIAPVHYAEDEIGLLTCQLEQTSFTVAADTGAVANVIHPRFLRDDADPEPNATGKQFTGAGGGHIERFGSCET